MARTLRLLTQNVKLFSSVGKTAARVAGEDALSDAADKRRTARLLDAILNAKPRYDVVCLQELFHENRRWDIKRRLKDNGYWVHVNVEDGHDAAPGSDRQLGVFADARLDRRSQHAGDVDLGDFGADDLNHVAFRIAPKSS